MRQRNLKDIMFVCSLIRLKEDKGFSFEELHNLVDESSKDAKFLKGVNPYEIERFAEQVKEALKDWEIEKIFEISKN